MQKSALHILALFKRLFVLLLIYSLCRILFYSINFSLFSSVPFSELGFILIHGVRFDIVAIVYCNVFFILLHILPLPWRDTKGYQAFLKVLFYSFNIPAIVLNCIDFIYFRFTLKRTTSDIFSWTGLGTDLKKLLPKFMADFWYVILLFAAFLFLINYLYKKTTASLKADILQSQTDRSYWGLQIVYAFFLSALIIVGARGGLQLRPLSIMSASDGIAPQNVTLVLNTPFTILQTFKKEGLKEHPYFSKEKADQLFPTYKSRDTVPGFQNKNVVVIIMESFSSEYIGGLNSYKGYTPFLDSLMQESLTFTNAFANGKKSMEGIPAILAGLPTLMDNPYITSAYSGNQFNSLANLLKKQGYETSFFHGGTNGTMGFDNFTKMAGFDSYHGRSEYNNETDYDNFWGIYDEPFMQYFANALNEKKQPFLSCFFSLSSHHPYMLPVKYKNYFSKGTLDIHSSIMYSDYSLRKFFETASRMPWFKNTLFVITADHTSLSEYPQYQTSIGSYRIPILFYKYESDLKGKSREVVQQADILPSVLDYLKYPLDYVAFGESVFRPGKLHHAVNYINNVYQYVEKEYLLQFNGEKSIGLYKYPADTLLQNNVLPKEGALASSMAEKLKAIIQTYNYKMIHNKLTNP